MDARALSTRNQPARRPRKTIGRGVSVGLRPGGAGSMAGGAPRPGAGQRRAYPQRLLRLGGSPRAAGRARRGGTAARRRRGGADRGRPSRQGRGPPRDRRRADGLRRVAHRGYRLSRRRQFPDAQPQMRERAAAEAKRRTQRGRGGSARDVQSAKYFVASRRATAISGAPCSSRKRRTRSRIALGEFAQPPADRLLDEPLAVGGEARRPAEHALGVAPVLGPRQGEDQRRAARPQMRALDPGFDDVEPRRIGDEAARRRRWRDCRRPPSRRDRPCAA